MGSTKVEHREDIPFYTTDQNLIRLKISSGLIPNDEDYKLVIEDCSERYDFTEFSEEGEEYKYVALKYGNLNINKLNRVLRSVRNAIV